MAGFNRLDFANALLAEPPERLRKAEDERVADVLDRPAVICRVALALEADDDPFLRVLFQELDALSDHLLARTEGKKLLGK